MPSQVKTGDAVERAEEQRGGVYAPRLRLEAVHAHSGCVVKPDQRVILQVRAMVTVGRRPASSCTRRSAVQRNDGLKEREDRWKRRHWRANRRRRWRRR